MLLIDSDTKFGIIIAFFNLYQPLEVDMRHVAFWNFESINDTNLKNAEEHKQGY